MDRAEIIREFLAIYQDDRWGVFWEEVDKMIQERWQQLRKDGPGRHDYHVGYLDALEHTSKIPNKLRHELNRLVKKEELCQMNQ